MKAEIEALQDQPTQQIDTDEIMSKVEVSIDEKISVSSAELKGLFESNRS